MADTAKDLVKKDLKENKLKVPELDEKTKKHLDQMALLEIRAELDPYLIDNPTARLGFDIIERGVDIDGRGGGELLAMIASGDKGLYNYNFSNDMYGMMMPSSRLKETPRDGPLLNTDKFPDRYKNTTEVLRRQGIESLLPASKGSTIYYETGYIDPDSLLSSFTEKKRDEMRDLPGYYEKAPSDQGLSTLMEELSHLGMRYLQTEKGQAKKMAMAGEEKYMDYQQGRSAAQRGVYAMEDEKERYAMGDAFDVYKSIDESAIKALKERGMTATPVEPAGPTIMERLLGMFN